MKAKHIAAIVTTDTAMALLVGIALNVSGCGGTSTTTAPTLGTSSLKLQDVELNPQLAKLQQFDKDPSYGVVIDSPSGIADSLIGFVGVVLVKDEASTGMPFRMVGNYRPNKDQILLTPADKETIYEGIVTNSAAAKGSFATFAANLGVDEAAEVHINNELILQYKDQTTIPWKELKNIPLERGKSYWFVDSVLLTTTSYKKYRKAKASTDFAGTAFAAHGDIYTSTEGFLSQRKLRLRTFDLRLARSISEGSATTPEISTLMNKDNLTTEDSKKLLEALRRESFEAAQRRLSNIKVKESTGDEFKKSEPKKGDGALLSPRPPGYVVRVGNVPSLKQEKTRGCWATVAAMLYGWKTGHRVTAFEFLNAKCPQWADIYTDNSGLAFEEKEAFLRDAGFTFEYGASYLPKAVEDMLRIYGPLWFTVDENASVHASVVVGLLQTMDDLYVSYIDPYDGNEYDETYSSFHNRYEEPARQFNLDKKMMEKYVQGMIYPVHVVHYNK
jgi:Papain-like cysteine protease AvrRpt2